MKSLIKQIKAESSNKRNLIEEMSKTIKIEDNKNNLKIFTQKFEYQKYYFTQKKHVNHVLNLLQKENTHTNYQVGIVITHAEKIKDSFNNKLYISTITLPHTSSIIQQDPNIPIKQDIKEKKQSKAILSFIKTNAIEK